VDCEQRQLPSRDADCPESDTPQVLTSSEEVIGQLKHYVIDGRAALIIYVLGAFDGPSLPRNELEKLDVQYNGTVFFLFSSVLVHAGVNSNSFME
jgi:hypothetical protein